MNPFYGVPQEKLETWLEQAREELATGKQLVNWGAADASGANAVIRSLSPERRIELLYEALNALAPEEYPIENARRVRRTTPRYVW